MFDGTLIFLIAVLAAVAALAHWRGGTPAVMQGFSEGWATLVRYVTCAALPFIAGFAARVLSR